MLHHSTPQRLVFPTPAIVRPRTPQFFRRDGLWDAESPAMRAWVRENYPELYPSIYECAVSGSNAAVNAQTTNVSSATEFGITIAANTLCLVSIFTNLQNVRGIQTISSVAGSWAGSNTFTSVNGVANGTSVRTDVFRFMDTGSNTGNIVITWAGTVDSWSYCIDKFTGASTTGSNGSGAIVQSVTDTGSSSSETITLASLTSASNASFGAFAINSTSTGGAGSGYTSLGDNTWSNTEYKATGSTTVDTSGGNSAARAGIGIEIAVAASPVANWSMLAAF